VIALTGHTDLYEAEKLKEAGFDNHLNKPFKLDVIKEAIQEGFEVYRRRTGLQDKTS
jgi:FixJ family two-component response regulator